MLDLYMRMSFYSGVLGSCFKDLLEVELSFFELVYLFGLVLDLGLGKRDNFYGYN